MLQSFPLTTWFQRFWSPKISQSPIRIRSQSSIPLHIHHHPTSGWVDYYLGAADPGLGQQWSLLDPASKIGLHYLPSELSQIRGLSCPESIPLKLWQQLQRKSACLDC